MSRRTDRGDRPGETGQGAEIDTDSGFDALLDAMLDRELSDEDRAAFTASASRHPAKRREVLSTTRAVSMLRDPVRAPDLSGAILSRVERRTPLLSERLARLVRPGRVAAVAASVAVALGLVGLRGALVRAHSDEPVASLATATASDLRDAPASVSTGVDALGNRLLDAVLPPTGEETFAPMNRPSVVVVVERDAVPEPMAPDAVAAAFAMGIGPVAAPATTPLVILPPSAPASALGAVGRADASRAGADRAAPETPGALLTQTVVRTGNAGRWASARGSDRGGSGVGWFSEFASNRSAPTAPGTRASGVLVRSTGPAGAAQPWPAVDAAATAVSAGYADGTVHWTSRADGSLVRSQPGAVWSKLLAPVGAPGGDLARTIHGGVAR